VKNKIKIIYIGTPEIAVAPLQKLLKNKNFEVCAVITQPDKPAGRKKIITPSQVKIEALKHGLRLLQPAKISEIIDEVNNLAPDIIVVMAYSQILPKALLDIPKFNAINIHTSLLPKYRGASPIQAAIMNGDNETGITFMLIDAGLDTGPILKALKIKIKKDDTTESLSKKLSILAAENITKTVSGYIGKKIIPKEQDNSQASYAKELKKNDARIDWSLPSEKIDRFIRAMLPWPVAFTTVKDCQIKIYNADIIDSPKKNISLGEILVIDKKMAVKTLDGILVLNKIQASGKKIMDSKNFLMGKPDVLGKIAQ